MKIDFFLVKEIQANINLSEILSILLPTRSFDIYPINKKCYRRYITYTYITIDAKYIY